MDENILHTCCFLGHRKIRETEELKKNLRSIIENLIITEKTDTFLFGSNSEFDDLSLNTVTSLQAEYPHIKRIYVRSSFPEISDNYKAHLLESYDETYFPASLQNAGKASYVKRNQEMILKSRFCIFYYDDTYLPPKRKTSTRDALEFQPKSGTAVAFSFALQKKREIINIFRTL